MTVRYTFYAEPQHAAALQRVMGEIGIRFDPRKNLCALINDNVTEGIFLGNDLDWLPQKANEHLEDQDHPYRFRNDLDRMDDLLAQYEFLMLMTLHSDWDHPGGDIREIGANELESFRERHPMTMHPAGEQPEALPEQEA